MLGWQDAEVAVVQVTDMDAVHTTAALVRFQDNLIIVHAT